MKGIRLNTFFVLRFSWKEVKQMNTALVNNKMQFSYPDGFSVLSDEEIRQLYQTDNPDIYAIRNTERHITLAVFHHKTNTFLVKLASAKDVAKSTESRIRKGMKQAGYQLIGFNSREAAGQTGEGFRYQYSVQGIGQQCDVLVLKHQDTCYTVYYYTRPELSEENQKVYDDILDSITFTE